VLRSSVRSIVVGASSPDWFDFLFVNNRDWGGAVRDRTGKAPPSGDASKRDRVGISPSNRRSI